MAPILLPSSHGIAFAICNHLQTGISDTGSDQSGDEEDLGSDSNETENDPLAKAKKEAAANDSDSSHPRLVLNEDHGKITLSRGTLKRSYDYTLPLSAANLLFAR